MNQILLVNFKNKLLIVLTSLFFMISCQSQKKSTPTENQSKLTNTNATSNNSLQVGANRTEAYLPLLEGKRVGVVANQTSVIFKENKYIHLVDSLVSKGLTINKVFAPEHGFRGKADAGEAIKDSKDAKTGISIVSIYGKNKKPSKEQLKDIDIMLFDIQDVGARFYTYISSLHYIMEACAENKIPVVVLDRPNPNGHYIDGPLLELEHKSFVGMHPVPIVHGMTIGEYAKMINGEQWLKNGVQCELKVVPMLNYNHTMPYSLPIKPSPNLPNDKAINLYPSLCFFEGTPVSAGRGTDKQFQIFGAPELKNYSYSFTPKPNEGAKYPKHQDKQCFGKNLTSQPKLEALELTWIIEAYNNYPEQTKFFKSFFTKLAGTKKLQQQIEQGLTPEAIKATWKMDLEIYDIMRQPYLLYK